MDFLILAASLALIIIGSVWLTDGSVALAERLKIPQFIVGLTIMAVGTSMPEFVVSFLSAWSGHSDMAIGNVVGSNIFNIIFILGFSCLVSPITVGMEAIIDTVFAIIVTVVGLIFSATKLKFQRWEGAVFVVTYVAYLTYMILRAYEMLPAIF